MALIILVILKITALLFVLWTVTFMGLKALYRKSIRIEVIDAFAVALTIFIVLQFHLYIF